MGSQNHGPRQAGLYLRELLGQRNRYRSIWQPKVERDRGSEVNYSAVAKVISDYLDDYGTPEEQSKCETGKLAPRGLRDIVARALNGTVLSRRTLDWFLAAFRINASDAERLRRLLNGSEQIQFVCGGLPMTPALGPQSCDHQTVSLQEFHYLGPDGQPAEHRTIQVVRALKNDFARYPYRFDTNAVTVEVLKGGRPTPIRHISDQVYAVDIALHRPLKRDETALLEYRTTFHYDRPQEPYFNRAMTRRVEHVTIRVEFDPAKLPKRIWWATWDGLGGPIKEREEVFLEADHSVHRYLDGVEQALVGFCWQWWPVLLCIIALRKRFVSGCKFGGEGDGFLVAFVVARINRRVMPAEDLRENTR
jgi:hypothetical protein